MSASRWGESDGLRADRTITLRLESFAWEAIDDEAAREGVTIEDLVAFSVLYYLADIDSGRIARQISKSPYRRRLTDRPDGGSIQEPPNASRRLISDPD